MDAQEWGISVSRSGENRVSVVTVDGIVRVCVVALAVLTAEETKLISSIDSSGGTDRVPG
jgi:hypothetical protein